MSKIKNRYTQFESFYIPVPESGCWIWLGTTGKNNYGKIKVNYKTLLAHRQAYLLYKGSIPDGMQVLHSCDNTFCVNPTHLRLGTQSENIQEMYNKGRFTASHWSEEKRIKHSKQRI